MMDERAIWLDMDGNFVDLYGVENWLEDLTNHNPRPYIMAKPLVCLSVLARTLNKLQKVVGEFGQKNFSKSPKRTFNWRLSIEI